MTCIGKTRSSIPVSSFNKDANGKVIWDGIRMSGPYSWRPPSYWFSDQYKGTTGSCAEQGDNESIPPYESLKKFIPADKLWPINDWWYYHAGATDGNSTLLNVTKTIDTRYGPSSSAAEFAEKAQMSSLRKHAGAIRELCGQRLEQSQDDALLDAR